MSARIDCLSCRRPSDRCVCGLSGIVDNRTGITILQHPAERHHPFNTARLARASLRSAALHVVWPDAEGRLSLRVPVPDGAALLYPREDAVELGASSARPAHLVVIDGTWPQARVVYRDNPWLGALPHVRLSPAAPSRYRIRREPAPHCLSTIESIAEALSILEPDAPGLPGLLEGFSRMVDTQADQDVERVRRRKVRQRPTLTERLAAEWDRLVVGYAESIGLHGRGGEPRLIQWAAVRPSTGEVFDAWVALEQGLSPRQLSWLFPPGTGQPPPASTLGALVQRWSAFAGPDAVVATWSPRAMELLTAATGGPADAISLRSAYGNRHGGVPGSLDQLTARGGRPVRPLPVSGRAGHRLGHAVALAELLRDLGR